MINLFVYGLLRTDIPSPLSNVLSGFENHFAVLPDHMVVKRDGLFTIVPSDNSSAVGRMYSVPENVLYFNTDRIEGYPNLYDRKEVTVTTKGHLDKCFVYYRVEQTWF
jgi:gamma-glutamylcyclotransferase (GGCT)/AIG2-like uncharacterized protein YtfP